MKFGRLQNGLLRSQPETAPSNFISNPTPLKDTTGWSLYSDSASSAPTDGTGGSPTVTWTRTTSSPLSETASFLFTKDAANRQGQGVSYDFTINRADQAKVCRIDFDYEVASGTYADGDLTVWLYDVTNGGAPIQPSASSILNAIGPQKKQSLSFQTNSNSTSYRLIIHVASTSASAYTVKFDNVSVTRESIAYGNYAGYLGALTTTGSWTTNTTYTAHYWRTAEGNLKAEVTVSLSGAPNSAQLTVNVPNSWVMDTARMSEASQMLGVGQDVDSGVGRFQVQVIYESATQVGLYYGNDTGSGALRLVSGGITQAAPQTFASGDRISFRYEVPIVGWTTPLQLSSDADTREVSAKYSLTSNETTAANADHIMTNFTTKVYDSHGMVSGSRLTAPVPGKYKITLKALTTSVSWAATDVLVAWLGKNGATQTEMIHWERLGVAFTDRYLFKGNAEVELKAGETIDFNIRNNTGGGTVPVIDSVSGLSTIEIEKLSGPAQIAASETVNAKRYSSSTAAVYNSPTTVAWTTSDYDSHGGFGTSSVYTVKTPGKYQVTARVNLASVSASAVERIMYVSIRQSGAVKAYSPVDRAYSTTGREYSQLATTTLNCIVGDTIDIQVFQNLVTSTNVNNNGGGMADNFVCIERIG